MHRTDCQSVRIDKCQIVAQESTSLLLQIVSLSICSQETPISKVRGYSAMKATYIAGRIDAIRHLLCVACWIPVRTSISWDNFVAVCCRQFEHFSFGKRGGVGRSDMRTNARSSCFHCPGLNVRVRRIEGRSSSCLVGRKILL